MQRSLSSILFPEYRRRVLGLLLLRPDQALHGREIARRTGLAHGTLNRELMGLAEVGLLKRERRGNQVLYRADPGCPVFQEVASILRKTSGLADVLTAALVPLAGKIRVALVFGSMARGQMRAGSDIDVLLVGALDFAEGVKALYPAQEILGREINPVIYSVEEFRCKRAAGDPFLRGVLDHEKLFLIGNHHDLAKLAGDSPPGEV
jgi:predicted nucleotidyltransferase